MRDGETRPLGGGPAAWFAGAVGAAGALALVVRPLVTIDQDLWYHLSHGRWILAGNGIPDSSYFSFIEPERAWVAYYWLFGVVVYLVHALSGELGLIVLRASLYALTLAAVHRLVFARRPGVRPVAPVWGALLVSLVAIVLFDRFQWVRPHAVSYLLIAVSLLVIEVRPRWLPVLPVLAVLWVNVHGVEYPVMLAVILAYLAAYFFSRATGQALTAPWSENPQRRLIALTLAVLAIFATPHGHRLLRVPFVDTTLATSYINELHRLAPADALRIGLLPVTGDAASNAVLVLAILCAVVMVGRRPLPVAQLALVIAGVSLLARSGRFRPEMALLAIPLLVRAWPARHLSAKRGETTPPSGHRPAFARAILALVALLPIGFMVREAARYASHPWPGSPYARPVGTATFLERAGVGTRVLNHPDQGGYFQWRIGPRMRIFTDMEVPFLFHDEDHYLATAAFHDPHLLAGLIAQYRPDFIAAPIEPATFSHLIARSAPAYRPVFFDDLVTLYVDTERHPDLAAAWSFAGLDPLTLSGDRILRLDDAGRARLRATLTRMLEVAPSVDRPRRTLALLDWLDGRRDEALLGARQAAAAAPWSWQPLALLGNLALEVGRADEAVKALRRARSLDHEGDGVGIERSLARALAASHRPVAAYRAFEGAVGRFPRRSSPADLAQLGQYALAAGAVEEARFYLSMARRKVAPESRQAIERIDRLLERLPAAP